MNKLPIEIILRNLLAYIEKTKWKDWKSFDGLKSPLVKYSTFNDKYLRILWQQFFKGCKINLRRIFRIKKRIIPKTLGDLASDYLIFNSPYQNKKYSAKAISFLSCG